MLARYCHCVLRPYRQAFPAHAEAVQAAVTAMDALPDVTRRFAWFKQPLRRLDEDLAQSIYGADAAPVVPIAWMLGRRLCLAFCQDTR